MNGNNTDFGFGGIWGVIMLLIVAGLFGNGFGFGGGNAAGIREVRCICGKYCRYSIHGK